VACSGHPPETTTAIFYARQHVMLSASVRPSVCHTGVLRQNDAT